MKKILLLTVSLLTLGACASPNHVEPKKETKIEQAKPLEGKESDLKQFVGEYKDSDGSTLKVTETEKGLNVSFDQTFIGEGNGVYNLTEDIEKDAIKEIEPDWYSVETSKATLAGVTLYGKRNLEKNDTKELDKVEKLLEEGAKEGDYNYDNYLRNVFHFKDGELTAYLVPVENGKLNLKKLLMESYTLEKK